MSELQKATWTVIKLNIALISTYFLAGPFYYIMCETLRDLLLEQNIGEINTFLNWAFDVMYYAFDITIVIMMLGSLIWLFNIVRRKYYSTESSYSR